MDLVQRNPNIWRDGYHVPRATAAEVWRALDRRNRHDVGVLAQVGGAVISREPRREESRELAFSVDYLRRRPQVGEEKARCEKGGGDENRTSEKRKRGEEEDGGWKSNWISVAIHGTS